NPAGDNDLTTYPMLATSGFFAEGVCEVIGFEIGNLRPPQATLVRVEAATPAPFDAHVRGDRLVICDEACTHDFSHGGIPLLNRTFTLEKPVRRARIYATARGIYELSLNGARVGERLFEPGASQYDRHLFYQTYDVTQALTIGENAIDAALASGWWNEGQTFHLMNYNYWGDRQSLLLMLLIEYEDGAQESIVTEPQTWRVRNDGCVRFAGWFYGEHYDARRTGAPDWRGAVEVAAVDFSSLENEGGFMRWPVPTNDTPRIIASTGAPVAHIDTLTAVSMREPRPGVYVYDMGQNMVGVPQITMRGRSGEVAVLRYGEAIYPPLPEYGENAGMILTENYRDAISIDRYVFATDAPETYAPRFTFHGYRYIEITGVAEPPRIQDVQGNVFSSIAHDTGAFECANPLVNRLYQNIRWSQRGNFLSIPTDCPQRNERMGWAGDAQVFCRTAVYNADVYGFLRNYLLHTRDCQLPDGRFADIAPVGGGFGGIEWGSAGIIVAYELYRQYGDVRIIREHYAAMARYMEFLRGKGVPGLLDNVGPLSDWLATDMTTDSPLLWNAVYYHDAAIMGEMARAIGEDSDAQGYDALAAEIKENWNRAFVDPATGRTRALSGEINDTQASYAVPLAYGLFTDMQAAADHLARKTRALDHAVTTGFVGTAPLLPALTDGGYAADAYRALQNTRYPSWLYSVTEGATTIWERWNSVTREAGFGGNNAMNSFNHYSLGAVGAWMYEYALGIKRGRGSWRRFTLEPHIGDLDWARGHFETIYGEIRAEWAREGGQIVYRVRVPANTVADIKLPGGVRTVGSGEHTFTWR
ncbi:MAG: family 78 glycoside hydrolase catalytic domain, partial [Christensenellales bacterium]